MHMTALPPCFRGQGSHKALPGFKGKGCRPNYSMGWVPRSGFKKSVPEGCVAAAIFEKHHLQHPSSPWHSMPPLSTPSSPSCYCCAQTPLKADRLPHCAQKMPYTSQPESWSPVLLTFLDYSSLISQRTHIPGMFD